MSTKSLSAESIYAAIAILGVTGCTAQPPNAAPPSPAQAAPTATAPAGKTESSSLSGAGPGAVVDAGTPVAEPSKTKPQKGGSASCSAGTSGPDGKGH